MQMILAGLIGVSAAVMVFCFYKVTEIQKRIEEFEEFGGKEW